MSFDVDKEKSGGTTAIITDPKKYTGLTNEGLTTLLPYVLGNTGKTVSQSVGTFFNDITGVNSANAFNAEEAQKNRDFTTAERIAAEQFNSAEAQKQRDFQEYMDNTSVQRRMADLQQAGLNPMLAYSSAAGSGSGASAASVGSTSGSSASSSGNSAAAVGGLIVALASLVKILKK